jgi:hypothetical protein
VPKKVGPQGQLTRVLQGSGDAHLSVGGDAAWKEPVGEGEHLTDEKGSLARQDVVGLLDDVDQGLARTKASQGRASRATNRRDDARPEDRP